VSSVQPLKIVMTADAVGGVWQYALDLSAALTAAGHKITLAVLGPEASADQRRQALELPGLSLIETGLPLDWTASGPQPVRQAAKAIAALARSEGADLVHCNMPTLAGAADFGVPVVAVTHGCVATWWQVAKREPLASAYRWHREMMRQGLAAADEVVAPSASYAAAVRLLYSLKKLPRVVHNGRTPPVRRARREKPLQAALTVGRQWDAVKNARLLDKVAARLEVPFMAAGALRGPHGEEVTLDHLQALGQLEGSEIAALMASRPVFVSAASFEPFGLAVLEAAGAGCPLVLSDIPTFRELWEGAALFAPPGDEDAFHGAISGLLADPARARALGAAAERRAARFTPAAAASRMEAIYAGLLEREEAAA
jgi:glycosyltransferase involved in cell wall biosynthesis